MGPCAAHQGRRPWSPCRAPCNKSTFGGLHRPRTPMLSHILPTGLHTPPGSKDRLCVSALDGWWRGWGHAFSAIYFHVEDPPLLLPRDSESLQRDRPPCDCRGRWVSLKDRRPGTI